MVLASRQAADEFEHLGERRCFSFSLPLRLPASLSSFPSAAVPPTGGRLVHKTGTVSQAAGHPVTLQRFPLKSLRTRIRGIVRRMKYRDARVLSLSLPFSLFLFSVRVATHCAIYANVKVERITNCWGKISTADEKLWLDSFLPRNTYIVFFFCQDQLTKLP